MIFRKDKVKTHNKCSHCGKVDFQNPSDIIVIDTEVYTKIITICHTCNTKQINLTATFQLEEFKEVKLLNY